jgi:4-amino-4-deoxy-L-arabinose transferase-like glycosyltransferase
MSLRRTLLIVLALALVLRLVCFWQIWNNLPFHQITLPGCDQHTYNLWAQQIAGGDLLSRQTGPFYYTPLYAYLLAALYVLAGNGNLLAALALNAAAGLAAAGLAAALARRWLGCWQGLVAGCLFASCGTQIFIETMPLVDSLLPAILLGALLLVGHLRARDSSVQSSCPALAWGIAAGLLLGLAIVGRTSNLLVAAVLCLWVALDTHVPRTRPLIAAAVLAVSALVLPALVLARNAVMYNQWAVTTNGPPNLYLGNVPGAMGFPYLPPDWDNASARVAKSPDSAAAWRRELAAAVAADPAGFARTLLRKSLLFFNAWDPPDNGNFYFDRRFAPALWATLSPLPIYVLGGLGLVLSLRQWRNLTGLYLTAGAFALSIIAVFVSGRYKLPFLAFLCILGSQAVVLFVRWVATGDYRRCLGLLALAALLTLAAWPRMPLDFPGDDLTLRVNEYLPNAYALIASGRNDEALHMLADGVALFPHDFRLADSYTDLEFSLGRYDDCAAHIVAALNRPGGPLEAAPNLFRRLIAAYTRLGQTDQARRTEQRMRHYFPDSESSTP